MRHHLPALRTVAITLCLFLMGTFTYAQKIVPLNAPSKGDDTNAISISSTDYDPGTVLVGTVPANSGSKPVLVFIHGYTGDAGTWFGDNDMYSKAYNAGYRTAFVTVYPDRSMWVNGQLFSDQLAAITNYYGVNKVVVVAHSKGGLDTDAALVHYGGYSRVNRVITLGSPHWGSPLANLAQSGWVWWLSFVFGQVNEATYVMQTGYMDYFRSVTDTHPNNSYTDFRTVGGWDYDGNLWYSGAYLSVNGGSSWQGGNDGVVNYRDSRRPYSRELYSGYGNSRTKYDHFELNIGTYFWSTVQGQLPSTLSREDNTGLAHAVMSNPHAVVSSNMLVLPSQGESQTFTINSASAVNIEIRQPEGSASTARVGGPAMRTAELKSEKETSGLMKSDVSRMRITNPEAGQYTISADGPFIAMVTIEDNSLFELNTGLSNDKLVYNTGESMNLTVRLEDAAGNPLTGADVTGMLRLTGSTDGAYNQSSAPVDVTFTATGTPGVYTYTTGPINAAGVYNLSLDARKGDYARSLVHSVGVAERKGNQLSAVEAETFPNPFTDHVNVKFDLNGAGDVTFIVRDIAGREVTSKTVYKTAGSHELQWKPTAGTPEGLYLYEISAGDQSFQGKMIYRK